MLLHWNDPIGIEISDSFAYKWAFCGKTLVRGYFFLNDRLMSATEAVIYLNSLPTVKEIQQILPRLEGSYNIIVQRDDGFLACVDPVRSMPLFYQDTQEGLVLYDTLESKGA